MKKSRRDIPGLILKSRDFFTFIIPGFFIPGFFRLQNPGIFWSRDFLVPGFFDPGISRDIPGPGYPVNIPTQVLYIINLLSYFVSKRACFQTYFVKYCKNHCHYRIKPIVTGLFKLMQVPGRGTCELPCYLISWT